MAALEAEMAAALASDAAEPAAPPGASSAAAAAAIEQAVDADHANLHHTQQQLAARHKSGHFRVRFADVDHDVDAELFKRFGREQVDRAAAAADDHRAVGPYHRARRRAVTWTSGSTVQRRDGEVTLLGGFDGPNKKNV
jgi:hypothetical protein